MGKPKIMTLEALLKMRWLPLAAAATLTLLVSLAATPFYAGLEARFGDYLWPLMGDTSPGREQRIVVVDIDEGSVARYGAWPWPRERMARLLAGLTAQGVALRIIDMAFPTAKPDDGLLAAELSKTPTVLGQVLAIDADQPVSSGELQAGVVSPSCQDTFPVANAVIANAANLKAASAGHITPRIAEDGAVRRLPAVICHQGKAYAALALAARAEASGVAPEFEVKAGRLWLDPSVMLQHPGLPGFMLPLDGHGDILIPWWMPRNTMVSVSAQDVMEGKLPEGFLRGAWALVGATAFGVGDTVPTPLGGAVAGVEVHLQLLTGILDNSIPYQPRAAGVMQAIWGLVAALLLLVATGLPYRSKIHGPTLVGLLLLMATVGLHALSLYAAHLWLPWMANAVFIVLAIVLMAARDFWQSRAESALLYRNLSSYLPAHVARQIALQEPSSALNAHHEQVIVLYADLRNFSAWCDYLPAEQAGVILHSFYTLANKIINEQGGTTEEYVGDAVMGVWRGGNAGIKPIDAARSLVEAGQHLFGAETLINRLPPLAIGVGIEKGEVLVGSFGPARRRAYTLLGRTVTTAIHLQAMTVELAQPIIMGENAAKIWQGLVPMQSLGNFLLQDRAQSTELFVPRVGVVVDSL